MKSLLALLVCLVPSIALAASWHVSGQAFDNVTFVVQESNDPNFHATVYERTAYLAVSDDNGAPVTGLKKQNFVGYFQVCAGRICGLDDSTIIEYPTGPTNFEEMKPGVYRINFRRVSNVAGAGSPGWLVVKVLRNRTAADIAASKGKPLLPILEKAQVILK